MESKIPSFKQVDDQVQVLFALECIVNVDDEGRGVLSIVDFPEEVEFFCNAFNAVLVHDPRLEHFLHGELPAHVLNHVNFSEAAPSNGHLDREIPR